MFADVTGVTLEICAISSPTSVQHIFSKSRNTRKKCSGCEGDKRNISCLLMCAILLPLDFC